MYFLYTWCSRDLCNRLVRNPICRDSRVTNYTETNSAILNGGEWAVKSNTIDLDMYIPNQATDIAPIERGDVDNADFDSDGQLLPGYYTQNINLTPPPFIGRSSKVVYVLAVDITTVGADGNQATSNGDDVNYEIPKMYFQLVGEPGTIASGSIRLNTPPGFLANPNQITITNTDDDPIPEYATLPLNEDGNQIATAVAGGIELEFEVTMPPVSEYEVFKADVGVVVFIPEVAPGEEKVGITLINNVSNTALQGSNTLADVSGSQGNERLVEFTFSPSDPSQYEVLASDVTLTTSGLSSNFQTEDYREQEIGNSTKISIPYEIMSGENAVSLTFTGSASAVSTTDNPQYDFYVGLSESIANVSVEGASVTRHRGGPTSIERGQFFIKADEGYFLRAESFSQSGTTSGISGVDFIQVRDDLVEVIYDVTIGTADIGSSTAPRNITITQSGGVVLEPYSFTFVVNNLGIDGASVAFAGGQSTHRIGYNEGTTSFDSFQLIVTPAEGMVFQGTSTTGTGTFTDTSDEVAIDINEASAVNTVTGGIVTLAEALVTVAQAPTFVVDGALVFDLDINANHLPSTGGNFVLDVNVVGGSAYDGLFSLVPESSRVLYTGNALNDDLGVVRTATIQVATLPIAGRFLVSSITPSTSTAVMSVEGALFVEAIATGGGSSLAAVTAPDTTIELVHQDNANVTATVVASETLIAPEINATELAITHLGPTIPVSGGTALFQVTANGNWTTSLTGTLGATNIVGSDGSFSSTYTANNHTVSINGSYGPTSGGAGTTIIEVSMNDLKLGGFQNSGVIQTFSGASISLEVISPDALPNRIAVGSQSADIGSASATLEGISDNRAATYSANYPNWTFYN